MEDFALAFVSFAVSHLINCLRIYRNVRVAAEGTAPLVEDHMKVRINIPSYKLVYEEGCEDLVWYRWDKDTEEMQNRARLREEERRRIVQSNF